MLFEYASVGAFFLVAILFVFGALLFGRLLRPNRMYGKKLETYECGEAPVGQAWFNFNPRFYVVALIYIIFDIEIAFIYPVATVFKQWVAQGMGWFAFIEVLVFIGILLLGLAYVWIKGDLEWIRALRPDHDGPQDVHSTDAKNTRALPDAAPQET
jgi:NADH-quinone oxidoreductase subunit A